MGICIRKSENSDRTRVFPNEMKVKLLKILLKLTDDREVDEGVPRRRGLEVDPAAVEAGLRGLDVLDGEAGLGPVRPRPGCEVGPDAEPDARTLVAPPFAAAAAGVVTVIIEFERRNISFSTFQFTGKCQLHWFPIF